MTLARGALIMVVEKVIMRIFVTFSLNITKDILS